MNRLKDAFQRRIDYMRISVTDRCNLRCVYCMPEGGVAPIEHKEILRYEEIIRIVKIAVPFGVRNIRLTGGEPLVRKNIVYLINRSALFRALTTSVLRRTASSLNAMRKNWPAPGSEG